jgi:hypothetical protein
LAKNDYFVIAYKILSYLYTCLKEGEDPDRDFIRYDSDYINISEKYWEYITHHLYEDGFIEGVALIHIAGQPYAGVKTNHIMITPLGIEYLESNSAINKAKAFLKEIKEIVPGM